MTALGGDGSGIGFVAAVSTSHEMLTGEEWFVSINGLAPGNPFRTALVGSFE
jgi:hypothetical protein